MDKRGTKHRKRFLVCAVLLSFLIIAVLLYRRELGQEINTEETMSNKCTVVWENKKWNGIYEGEMANSKPSGKGVFVSDNNEISYDGEWGNGKFNGNGKISYDDGTWECGSYKEGKRDGISRFFSSDDSYIEKRYSEGIPYGKISICDNNKEESFDYYVNSTLLSDIKKEAELLSYEILRDKKIPEQYLYVQGKVVFVGQDDEKCYFRIDTDSVGMVIGSYENGMGQKDKQAYMPLMKAGDQVRIYGYCVGTLKDNCIKDIEGFGFEYPCFEPFYGEILSEEAEKNSEHSYNFLQSNPYAYYGESVEGKFEVMKVIHKGKRYYIQAVRKGSAFTTEKYTLFYKSSMNEMYYTGQILEISGYYDGQYKRLQPKELADYNEEKNIETGHIYTYSYDMEPLIHITEIH